MVNYFFIIEIERLSCDLLTQSAEKFGQNVMENVSTFPLSIMFQKLEDTSIPNFFFFHYIVQVFFLDDAN